MNILFVLYGDFTSNSINHIAPFAAELSRRGHACAVAVPYGLDTAFTLDQPAFRPLLFEQALAESRCFPDGRAADLLHVWTPREIIRDFVFAYLAEQPETLLLVHLEDGERDITAAALGIPTADLDLFSERELARRLPVDRSHPRYAECLLLLADGVTVIQDKLASLAPPFIPRLTLYPGVDLALFQPRAPDLQLRAALGITAAERIILYQGGMNPVVFDEIRDLYLAVGWLNRQGYSCRLIRTGPGRPPFLESLPALCRNQVLDLGYVERQRLPDLLALADVCVQPGRFTSFNDLRLPSKIPEWLAMAKPVIMPEANIATLLEDGGNCMLLREGTPQEIAAKCAWLFDHPDQAREMGQRGRQFAERHFALPEQARILAEFYQQIATEALSADSRCAILAGIHPAAPPALFAFRKLRHLMQQPTDDSSIQESPSLAQFALQRLDAALSRWEQAPLTAPERYFNLRLYADWGQGFSEIHSLHKSGVMNQGTHLRLQFPEQWEGDGSLTLRLDPHDDMALIEINALRVRRRDDDALLWTLDTANAADVTIGGDALRLPGAAPLTLISLGADPWLVLPTLTGTPPAVVQVELALRVADNPERIRDGLLWLAQERNEAQAAMARLNQESRASDTVYQETLASLQQQIEQAEDRETTLESQLAEQQRALKQAKDREATLESQLAEQQRALKQAKDREATLESQLVEQQRALATALERAQGYETLLKTRSADLRMLVRLFETLQQDTRLAFDSLSWRLGYAVAEVGRRLTFSKRIPLVQDHVAHLEKTYQSWRQTTTSLDSVSAIIPKPFSVAQPLSSMSDEVLDFDEATYLAQYPDVRAAVERGQFKSGREHWEHLGREEIAQGRRFYVPGFQPQPPAPPKEFTIRDTDRLRKEIARWRRNPLISIVMPVYNVEARWLKAAVESVRNQVYPHWQLCIADDKSTRQETLDYLHGLQDKRIKTVFLEKNQGIAGASNAALALATGEFVALMDNDDELTPDAIYEVAKAINDHDSDLIYSDEDKLTMDGRRVEPHFKPDYSPDLLFSTNYISHLSVYRLSVMEKIGGFRQGYEGSQDYDLVLRFLDHSQKVYHIPKILYHWRMIPGSTAASYESKNHAWEAGRIALEDTLKRRGIQGNAMLGSHEGTYRVRRTLLGEPRVSIIIPFKDHALLLQHCLDSILEKTSYQNFEILGVSNNSTDPATFALMEHYQSCDPRIRFICHDIPFNYSTINNHAVRLVAGEHLILLNNDMTVITPNWIEALLEHSQRPEVGAVGAKLYYPDDTIQHGGVIIGLGGVGSHSHKYFDREMPGYFCRLIVIQNLSAVTAACLMIKKSLYEKIGGLNEKDLAIAFNDVDFCLRLREEGYLNVFTPYCELYHYESKSRGDEDTLEKKQRFIKEIAYMRKRHAKILEAGDPYYNPNLTLNSEDFGLA